MYSMKDELLRLLKSKAHIRIIFLNVAVFVILKLINSFLYLSGNGPALYQTLISSLAVPVNIHDLAFRPWSLFTYMFVHENFFHLLFNMLMLYWFGKIFQEFLGNTKITFTYMAGGIAGAFLYILAFNTIPMFREVIHSSFAIGASAGIMAIVMATAALVPNYSLYMILIGPVAVKYIAVFFFLLDLLNMPDGNAGGHIAHLGGAIFGFIFVRQLRKGNDPSAVTVKYLKKISGLFKTGKPKMKVAHKRPVSDLDFISSKAEKQQLIDSILDKIAKSGYDSLSKKEKETLFKISKDEI